MSSINLTGIFKAILIAAMALVVIAVCVFMFGLMNQ
jgi:hypothetical protein